MMEEIVEKPDKAYFLRRAKEELAQAKLTACPEAQLAHASLAQEYLARAEDPDRGKRGAADALGRPDLGELRILSSGQQ
jgi:hypothetical protein